MAIRVLCVNDDVEQGGDRPTGATFVGMHRQGVEVTVVCSPEHPHYRMLVDEGIPTVDIPIRKNFDRQAIRLLRAELSPARVAEALSALVGPGAPERRRAAELKRSYEATDGNAASVDAMERLVGAR